MHFIFHYRALKNSNIFCQTLIFPRECKYMSEPPNVIRCFGKSTWLYRVVWIELGKSIICPVPGSDIISQLEGVLLFKIIDFVMPWAGTGGKILSSSLKMNKNFVCKESKKNFLLLLWQKFYLDTDISQIEINFLIDKKQLHHNTFRQSEAINCLNLSFLPCYFDEKEYNWMYDLMHYPNMLPV